MKVKIITGVVEFILFGCLVSAWLFLPPWGWGDTLFMIFYSLFGIFAMGLIYFHRETLFS